MTFTYTYDNEGNRLTKFRKSPITNASDNYAFYTYDHRNRLILVEYEFGNLNSTTLLRREKEQNDDPFSCPFTTGLWPANIFDPAPKKGFDFVPTRVIDWRLEHSVQNGRCALSVPVSDRELQGRLVPREGTAGIDACSTQEFPPRTAEPTGRSL